MTVSQPAPPKAPRAPGELALAVLPIQNYSSDAAQTYFADGVTADFDLAREKRSP